MNKNKSNLNLGKYWKYFSKILFLWTLIFSILVFVIKFAIKMEIKNKFLTYSIQVFAIYLFVLTTKQLSTYFDSSIEKLEYIIKTVRGMEGQKDKKNNSVEKFHKTSKLLLNNLSF